MSKTHVMQKSAFSGVVLDSSSLRQSSIRNVNSVYGQSSTRSSSEVLSHMYIVVDVVLPIYLSPLYWERHKLSTTDLLYLFEKTSALHLWRLVLLLGTNVSGSAVRPSHSKAHDVLISAKGMAIEKITTTIAEGKLFRPFPDNQLLQQYETLQKHEPIIPMYQIGVCQYKDLMQNSMPVWSCFQVNPVNKVMDFLDCQWVASAVEELGICCTRIIPETLFQSSGAYSGQGLATKPLTIEYQGGRFCTLDESIIVCCAV